MKDKPNKITTVLKVVVTGEFYDDDATEATLRYAVEQDLEDAGFDVDVSMLKEQQPKTGHWKYYNINPETEFPTSLWECDVCSKRIYGVGKSMEYQFCPYCGAKMEKQP